MALQSNSVLTWGDLASNFLNALIAACCNIDGYSSDVPAKLRSGQGRVQIHSMSVGDHDDWQTIAWFADTANLITTVSRTNDVETEWNAFLGAAGITSRLNDIVAARDLELAMADFMQFLSFHVKPVSSIRQIYQEVETPYLYKANQYVTGTTPTPVYVFPYYPEPDPNDLNANRFDPSVPEQQVTDNAAVNSIISKGFDIAQLMQRYNGTNAKVARCYLS